MKHLIKIEDLTVEEINQIYLKALDFEKGLRTSNHKNACVCSMFFENSTRTKLSFEMAIEKLLAKKFDFSFSTSSINKGEDLFDTINNLSAIGMNAIILRHTNDNLIEELSKQSYFKGVSFINAGSGKTAHPTQALLDFYTIRAHFPDFFKRTITIVGDIAHSRVAKSNIALLKKYNVKIRCLAPKELTGEKIEGVEYFTSLPSAFFGADIIMALRIQKERFSENEHLNLQEYINDFQINSYNLPDNAILMHPGPVNKGVEISEELLNSQKARTILEQARNGVYVRMAVLDTLLSAWGV